MFGASMVGLVAELVDREGGVAERACDVSCVLDHAVEELEMSFALVAASTGDALPGKAREDLSYLASDLGRKLVALVGEHEVGELRSPPVAGHGPVELAGRVVR